MHARAAGGDHHSIQFVFFDRFFDRTLPEIRTAILEVCGKDHSGYFLYSFYHCLHVNHGRDVRSSLADEGTDSWHQAFTLSSDPASR
jgi:hypothetical protein